MILMKIVKVLNVIVLHMMLAVICLVCLTFQNCLAFAFLLAINYLQLC